MDVERVRERTPRTLSDQGARAAVLVPLIDPTGEPHLLLTKRSELVPNHPGQMSFPGGRREPSDASLTDTAIREANEEVGVPTTAVEPIGQLDEIRTTSEFVVTPIVGAIPDRPYEPTDDEVAEVAVLPLEAFLDPDCYEREWKRTPAGGQRPIHYFRVDGYVVWGATGSLVTQLLELTTGWTPDAVA